jgi:diguanylate cyclase (GGDEF)-like protein
MHDLRAWYQQGLATRITTLETAAMLWRERPQEALDAVRRIAHALKGSGGTYGFPEISQAAQALEEAPAEAVDSHLSHLLEVLRRAAGDGAAPPARLLVVAHDPDLLPLLHTTLAAPGREIVVAGSTAAAEQILKESAVALVLLELTPAAQDGRQLLLRLRDRPATAMLPVLVLAAPSGPRQAECFALGADAYLQKPVDPQTLRAAVSARLRHSAEIAREARQDPLTGLGNRAAFLEACDRAWAHAQRCRQPLTLAVFDLDRFKVVNDTQGHATGDEVLRRTAVLVARSLRGADLLARWGGEEFVVLFPNTNLAGAASPLERALQAVRDECFPAAGGGHFHVTFSAGVAQFGPEAADPELVLAEADRCLYRAKEAGRDRIVRADDRRPLPPKRILFAEDDPAVVELVRDHLGRAGFDVVHVSGGTAALAAAADARAALVLLDVKLAESDGFEVLARLRRNAYLAQVPIVMLTAMGREQDILRGFDLGADDYVVKPFLPAELVARVRRLLRNR